jgi:isopentenyldiphosphate isomerase
MISNPAEEMVDLVDNQGRIIGVVPRQEMRVGRLPHRCVYILVFNHRGELFIHLRTSSKDVNPSHWDVAVGGVLAAGESFDLGAERETAEEIGIQAKPSPLFPFRHEDARTVVHGMVYGLVHDGPFSLQREEIVRGEFVCLDDLAARLTMDPFCADGLAVLAEYQRRIREATGGNPELPFDAG